MKSISSVGVSFEYGWRFDGYITAYDLYFGLINHGHENNIDKTTDNNKTISKCTRHLIISFINLKLLKKFSISNSISFSFGQFNKWLNKFIFGLILIFKGAGCPVTTLCFISPPLISALSTSISF